MYAVFFAGLASLGVILSPTLLASDLFDLGDMATMDSSRIEYFVSLCVASGTIAVASVTAYLSWHFERLR